MLDEVKLIYFYQLGAEGFRSGDIIGHPKYIDTIMKATKAHAEYQVQYRMQDITPQLMSRIMLGYLCWKG